MLFEDRREAGRALADALRGTPGDAVVLALPRGGVPVAFEVARSLRLPLDVFVVRKPGVPGQEELAMGAVASGGIVFTDPQIVRAFSIDAATVEAAVAREARGIERRETLYRAGSAALPLEGRSVLRVDDGAATGSSLRAAIPALRPRAARVMAAIPVAPPGTCEQLRAELDLLVCLEQPWHFHAVGEFYRNFDQTSDEEVAALLAESRAVH